VGVVLHEIASGMHCSLMAMGDETECPLHTFIAELAQSNQKEFGKVTALLKRVADHGLPRNEEKCRYFRDLQAFELKSGSIRVMAFWDEGRLIICSHAFPKKGRKTPVQQLERLKDAKVSYFAAKQKNRVVIAEENADD
jgi:phage-related protein